MVHLLGEDNTHSKQKSLVNEENKQKYHVVYHTQVLDQFNVSLSYGGHGSGQIFFGAQPRSDMQIL